MTRYICVAIFLLLSCIILASCASAPEADSDPGTQPAEEPADSPDAATTPGADSDAEASAPQQSEQADAGTGEGQTSEAVEDVQEVDEPEPISPPDLTLQPRAPKTGDTVTVLLDSSLYDTVTFDFGDGPSDLPTHTYKRFGRKSVTVEVATGDQTAGAALEYIVTGESVFRPEQTTAQHDRTWKPIIPAKLTAEGDFDSIAIYENQREIFRIQPQDDYTIPVPFVGTRRFSAALFHKGEKAADVDAVTITGLNSPPRKPTYEGDQFITVKPGEEVRFSVTAEDPNSNEVIYEVKFAPAGSEFDVNSGTFTWTPTPRQRDLFLLSFYAYDIPFNQKSPFAQRGIIVQ